MINSAKTSKHFKSYLGRLQIAIGNAASNAKMLPFKLKLVEQI
jgi:hypothetical protein